MSFLYRLLLPFLMAFNVFASAMEDDGKDAKGKEENVYDLFAGSWQQFFEPKVKKNKLPVFYKIYKSKFGFFEIEMKQRVMNVHFCQQKIKNLLYFDPRDADKFSGYCIE